MIPASSISVAVLIATRDRESILATRALPCIPIQTTPPDRLLIINDGPAFGRTVRDALSALHIRSELSVLPNARHPGAAGAWNTGLADLWNRGHRGYVAILDDDDEWAADHLQVNFEAICAEGADLSVSGLRMLIDGVENPRPLIRALDEHDFLVGNPGWQGSNTFIRLSLLREVGGFRESLSSLNDRDLAVRILRYPGVRWTLPRRWTATWHLDTKGGLSAARSAPKLHGLRIFWQIYGAGMTGEEKRLFFARAERLFSFGQDEIQAGLPQGFGRHPTRGDWDAAGDQQLLDHA